jgi:trans-aconitate methyltransferase
MGSFLFLVAFFFLLTAAYAGFKGAPFVPTLSKDIQQALSVLKNEKIESAIDLGCGTGSMLFAVAQERPDVQLSGYEVSLAPLLFGWIRKYLSPKKYKNVHLYWKNLYSVDVSFADVVFVFMMPEPHTRIAKTVLHRANPHAIVLFEAWPPEGFVPERIEKHMGCLPLHVYRGSAFRT